MTVHTILYVGDQKRSCDFYKDVLQMEPQLNVPGMTEFKLSDKHVLGLMPEQGIKRLLGDKLPDPQKANGYPRVELYMRVENAAELFQRCLNLGARELSPILPRDWGDKVGYVLDLDGHVLAFAT